MASEGDSNESDQQLREELQHYVERISLLLEAAGMPQMAGRIFGWLLVSEPDHQSLDELAAALQASKSSISTMTRYLAQMEILEQVSIPGDRKDYYRIRKGVWPQLFERRMSLLTATRQLIEEGLVLLANESDERRRRLRELQEVYAFFEREWPEMMERLKRELAQS